jgi:hypothetical protein
MPLTRGGPEDRTPALVALGANVNVVQVRLRDASAKTTLGRYAQLWPDTDEATRTAVDAVLVARAD